MGKLKELQLRFQETVEYTIQEQFDLFQDSIAEAKATTSAIVYQRLAELADEYNVSDDDLHHIAIEIAGDSYQGYIETELDAVWDY